MPAPAPTAAPPRISSSAAVAMRAAIRLAGGREVCFVCTLDDTGTPWASTGNGMADDTDEEEEDDAPSLLTEDDELKAVELTDEAEADVVGMASQVK